MTADGNRPKNTTKTMARGKLEHFQDKWNPVFRPKMRQREKMLEQFLFPANLKPLQWTKSDVLARRGHQAR
jgi:hypothetical protein